MMESHHPRWITADAAARAIGERLHEWLDEATARQVDPADAETLPELLSAAQVAVVIGRTPRRVRQLVAEGKLRPAQSVHGADGRAWHAFAREGVLAYTAKRDMTR